MVVWCLPLTHCLGLLVVKIRLHERTQILRGVGGGVGSWGLGGEVWVRDETRKMGAGLGCWGVLGGDGG